MTEDSIGFVTIGFVLVGISWAIAFAIWAMAKYGYGFHIEMKDENDS